MKKVFYVLSLLCVFILISCSKNNNNMDLEVETEAPPIAEDDNLTSDKSLFSEHEDITISLINMVEHNEELKLLLEKSIEKAKEINPNRDMNPAQSLEEFYSFIDWSSKSVPWKILPNVPKHHPKLYDQIDQGVDYLYFLVDQPLEELEDIGYYYNSVQYHEPFRSWLFDFITCYGTYLNTEDSWCDEYYEIAKSDPLFGLDGDLYESSKNWKTFNQFFARYLSSPDKRPITERDNNLIITAPADSKPQGIWNIDENSNLIAEEPVVIKSGIFSSVDQLIYGSKFAGKFAKGTMTHTFLDVNDYHRYHLPVSGIIKEVKIVDADDAAGGITTWDSKNERYVLHSDNPGWQMIETRGYVIIDTEEYGLVAVIPVGMSQISSVNFEKTIKVGEKVKKGDMLGAFLFGGSDIVMLFEEQANFELLAQKNDDGKYKHILTGEAYGVIKK